MFTNFSMYPQCLKLKTSREKSVEKALGLSGRDGHVLDADGRREERALDGVHPGAWDTISQMACGWVRRFGGPQGH